MKTILLGIGDCGVSKTPGAEIKTLALGSCVAVLVHHPPTGSVGMVHIALPDSSLNPERGKAKPGVFCDSGIPLLLKKLARTVSQARNNNLVIKMVGGAQIMRQARTFNIGRKNINAVKAFLKANNLSVDGQDIGGNLSRSVLIRAGAGEVEIWSPGRGMWSV